MVIPNAHFRGSTVFTTFCVWWEERRRKYFDEPTLSVSFLSPILRSNGREEVISHDVTELI